MYDRTATTPSAAPTSARSATKSITAAPNGASAGGTASSQRRRDGRDKRQIILDAAIKVFADKGYHGSRVSDIAREAGIAYGLVYHYFKNKEEILDTIFSERWGGFLEAIDAIAEGATTTEDKLLSIAALILNAYRVRPDWVKVLVFEIQRSSRFAEPAQLRAVGQLFRSVAEVLREGQNAGELRGDLDPDVACYLFVGALDLFVTGRVLEIIEIDGDSGSEREYHLKVARTLVELFVNGLRPRDPGVRGE